MTMLLQKLNGGMKTYTRTQLLQILRKGFVSRFFECLFRSVSFKGFVKKKKVTDDGDLRKESLK